MEKPAEGPAAIKPKEEIASVFAGPIVLKLLVGIFDSIAVFLCESI